MHPLDRDKRQDREYIKAHRLREHHDVGGDNRINSAKEHREDLCEKCQKLGRPCRLTAGQNYTSISNQPTVTVSLH